MTDNKEDEKPPVSPPSPPRTIRPTRLKDDGPIHYNAGDVTFDSGTNRLFNQLLDIKDAYMKSTSKSELQINVTVGVEVQGPSYPVHSGTRYGDQRGSLLGAARKIYIEQLIQRVTGIPTDQIHVAISYGTTRTINIQTEQKK